jgi:Ca-activated chloride channel family protein
VAGELNLRVLLARPIVPVLPTEQLVYSLVELRPVAGALTATLPLNLSLVLDRSGSMRGQKIERLRDATRAVFDLLQPQDTVSVIAFNNRAHVLVPSQPVTDQNRRQVAEEVRNLHADGGTQMAGHARHEWAGDTHGPLDRRHHRARAALLEPGRRGAGFGRAHRRPGHRQRLER